MCHIWTIKQSTLEPPWQVLMAVHNLVSRRIKPPSRSQGRPTVDRVWPYLFSRERRFIWGSSGGFPCFFASRCFMVALKPHPPFGAAPVGTTAFCQKASSGVGCQPGFLCAVFFSVATKPKVEGEGTNARRLLVHRYNGEQNVTSQTWRRCIVCCHGNRACWEGVIKRIRW